MDFLAELWRFMRVRKKFWLLPILIMMVRVRRPAGADQGLGGRAVHLHAVLVDADARPRHLGLLSRQRRRAGRGRPHRRRRAGGALHPQEARSAFPEHAIAYCLEEGGVKLDELDHVVFYDKPFLKFERLLETYIAFAPRGFRSFRDGDAALAAARSCSRRACCAASSQQVR